MAAGDEIPVTIEYRRILFGAGTLIDPTPICKRADDECCADEGDPTCCDGEYETELPATVAGPLDGSCGDETVPLTATWDVLAERWYGEANNALATYTIRAWFSCVNGTYLGTVQVLDSDGALIDESPDITLSPNEDCTALDGSYTPVGDLAPCAAGITVSFNHPCPSRCTGRGVPCCPDGFTEIVNGDLEGAGAIVLTYEAEYAIWSGAVSVGDETYVVAFWCDGETWTAWVDLYVDGELVATDTRPLAPGVDCTTLVADLVPQGDALTFEVEHPCAPAPCSDPGGAITACGCEGVSATLYATFGGTLASYGTQTLTHVGGTSWLVTPTSGACNGGVSPIGLTCAGGNVWRLSTPGHAGSPSTVFSADATPASCSPLSIAFSGTATGTCAGAWTATVSEIAP